MAWFFALEHPNYSRWLLVHIRDMKQLSVIHPAVYENFMKDDFIFHKTTNLFSATAIEHDHEQHNVVLKVDGSIIGITDNPSALLRWMVASPEMAKMVQTFESEYMFAPSNSNFHHKQNISTQAHLLQCFIENGGR